MEIRKIVTAVDFSPESDIAAKQGLRIARHLGAELVLVRVSSAVGSIAGGISSAASELEKIGRAQTAADRKALEELRSRLTGQGADVSHMVMDGPPADAVVDAAADIGAELIITGTHGRGGLKRFLLGSVAERVVRLAKCNVMVARKPPMDHAGSYQTLLVPVDFSPHSEAALAQAVGLVDPNGRIDVVHYWQMPVVPDSYYGTHLSETALAELRQQFMDASEKRGHELIDRFRHTGHHITFEAVRENPAHGIVERSEERDYDLVVMGSHGYRGVRRFILGSVAEKVVRHAARSVLVVHTTDTQ